jgi:hypothetical protein
MYKKCLSGDESHKEGAKTNVERRGGEAVPVRYLNSIQRPTRQKAQIMPPPPQTYPPINQQQFNKEAME